jgi:lipopolysaccharide/colanic/teichoic acid biosynthesis glycosyltransferase
VANRFQLGLKRVLDVVVSAVALLLGLPLMGLVAAAIVIDSGRPVFFRQLRMGRNCVPFRLLKFRSMLPSHSGPLVTVAGDSRVTRVGRWLRRTKLDEWPQFLNVLVGEMSLVGPRPEVPEYFRVYEERYRRILTIRPGITDLASIRYRNEEEILAASEDPREAYVNTILPAKLSLGEEYLETLSVWLDFKILFQTLWAIVH